MHWSELTFLPAKRLRLAPLGVRRTFVWPLLCYALITAAAVQHCAVIVVAAFSFPLPCENTSPLMPTILFIDDHTCGSHTVPQTLRACGYEVQVSPDAREALTLFRLYPIDA